MSFAAKHPRKRNSAAKAAAKTPVKTRARKQKRNGLLNTLFGTRETVYPMRKYSKPASGRAPAGVETRYLGAVVRRLPEGDYATGIDWDSRFDTLKDVHAFIRSWQKRNPRSLRNPETEAAELSEEFHGRAPREVNEVIENVHYHENLMQIGPLLELDVETVSGFFCTLEFPPADALDRVILAWSEDGSTPYIVGGDQEIDLADLHMDAKKYRKDLMVIGAIKSWVYYAEKEQDHWEGSEYFHTSREGLSADKTRHKVVADTDTMLLYDTRSQLLQCAGGEANLYDAAVGIVG